MQLAYVYNQGHYIARRWDDVHQADLLYKTRWVWRGRGIVLAIVIAGEYLGHWLGWW